MTNVKISELVQTTDISDDDLLIMETANGTRSVSYETVRENMITCNTTNDWVAYYGMTNKSGVGDVPWKIICEGKGSVIVSSPNIMQELVIDDNIIGGVGYAGYGSDTLSGFFNKIGTGYFEFPFKKNIEITGIASDDIRDTYILVYGDKNNMKISTEYKTYPIISGVLNGMTVQCIFDLTVSKLPSKAPN